MPDKKNLLIGVSGGIAAFKVCTVASYFTKMGVNVNVVMTEHGAEFVTPLTFEALTKNLASHHFSTAKATTPLRTSISGARQTVCSSLQLRQMSLQSLRTA